MARRAYARGRRAWGMDARTNERVLLRDLVRDGHTGLPVTRESYEPKHPQETPVDVFDPQILRRPAPDLDNVPYEVYWPTGDFEKLWEHYTNPRATFAMPGKAPYIASDLAIAVAASDDDANEVVSTGVASVVGTVIGFQDDRVAGFRFRSIGIAKGLPVPLAWVQFSSSFEPAEGTTADACTVTIWGEDSDDAAAFTANNTDVSGRTTTTASVSWLLPESVGSAAWLENARGPNQRTPNIGAIIEEIVGRANWVAGNDLVLIFKQTSGGSAVRQVAAWDHAALAPAMLFVDAGTLDGSGQGEDSPFDGGFDEGFG